MGSSPARADRCDDLAKQLSAQITGLKIGKTMAGVIYLEHPAVTQASLGCSSRNRTNDVFASTDKRKPAPEFYDFVATAAALVFTIPKPDALKGAQRCVKRTNIIRGYNISSRYRRLDIHCTRRQDRRSDYDVAGEGWLARSEIRPPSSQFLLILLIPLQQFHRDTLRATDKADADAGT